MSTGSYASCSRIRFVRLGIEKPLLAGPAAHEAVNESKWPKLVGAVKQCRRQAMAVILDEADISLHSDAPLKGYRRMSVAIARDGCTAVAAMALVYNQAATYMRDMLASSEEAGEVVLLRIRPCDRRAGRLSAQAIEGIYSQSF